jgi:hypothetical protein
VNGEAITPLAKGDTTMRFMIIRRADADTEAFKMPTKEQMADMGAYMESMHKAGILVGADGLKPTSHGARVTFSKGKPSVVDGPFTEAKELISGYSIIDVPTLADAIAWAKKWPASDADGHVGLEIRPFFSAADFPPDILPPEELAKVQSRREEVEAKAKK